MRLEGHVGRVFGVAYMDDLITGDSEGTLRLWNESGGLLKTVEAHPSAISAVAVSKTEGWAVSAGEDGSIKFWDRQLISTSDSLASIAGGATSVAIPPGGDFVAVSGRAGLVGFWNRDGSEKRRPIRLDDNTLWDLAFSPDGQYLATASADEVVEVWLVSDLLDSDQPQPIQVLSPQSRGASAVRFGQTSDLLYTADRNGGVRLWNPIEGKSLSPVLHLFDGDVWGLATSPLAESAIASGPGGGVFLIDLLNLDRACELTNLAADQELLDTYLSGESRTACPA
jgi:WD40 repeat protein